MPTDNTTAQGHYRCLVYNAMLRSKGGNIIVLTSAAVIGRTISSTEATIGGRWGKLVSYSVKNAAIYSAARLMYVL